MSTTLMIQGTTSDAGKSLVVAGLCRLLARQGIRVAPFKPQNMALNSAVTADGREIGRAQAMQAFAAGIPAQSDMNPILLKPNSDTGAQVIVQGVAVGNMNAQSYHQYKPTAMRAVLESYQRLCQQFDVLLVEGAGSPAEINLREQDIANMGFAEAVDCPVLLVADIDRGGVFAHLVGTLAVLSGAEQARVAGFIINRFRGDLRLLQPGIDWLTDYTGKPTLGVLPYLHELYIEAEDSLSVTLQGRRDSSVLRVVVPRLPKLSNSTDFDPLVLHPQISFRYVTAGEPIPAADLIILPGSKHVQSDLAWLIGQGWEAAILKHLRYGGKLLGVCGGLQMLGRTISDPLGVESSPGSVCSGLGLLNLHTRLQPEKQLRQVAGVIRDGHVPVRGYEIHAGVSTGEALNKPWLQLGEQPDGAVSADGQIIATYVHGLFDQPQACEWLLHWLGQTEIAAVDPVVRKLADLDRLADALQSCLDLQKLGQLLKLELS